PAEQTDFEMKTREMPAVDLEELGLSEGMLGSSLPIQRLSSPGMELGAMPDPSDLAARFTRREPTELDDDVVVDLDGSVAGDDGVIDAGATLEQDSGRAVARAMGEIDLDDASETT